MNIIVWSKLPCEWCEKAKSLLRENNMEYEERVLGNMWKKEDLLAVAPKATKVPQIFIANKLIGGYTDLVEYLNSSK